MPKTVTLRLSDETYTTFLEAAKAENRSLSNLIETAALARVREQQFADDVEVAEIMANEELMKRIKKGSQEARLRKGTFVD
jgi:predicted transcriptional regulator